MKIAARARDSATDFCDGAAMRLQRVREREGTATALAALLLVLTLVLQAILGAALLPRGADRSAGLDPVLCLSQSDSASHDSRAPADEPRHAADCLAACQLAASGPAAPLADPATTVAAAGFTRLAQPRAHRSLFVLDTQVFLAAARAPPALSA